MNIRYAEKGDKERIVKLIILSEELNFSLVRDLLIDFLIELTPQCHKKGRRMCCIQSI